jgi:hypothetical protein
MKEKTNRVQNQVGLIIVFHHDLILQVLHDVEHRIKIIKNWYQVHDVIQVYRQL